MYRLNFQRGLTRIGIVAFVLLDILLLIDYGDTPLKDRPPALFFLLTLTLGAGGLVFLGVLCAMYAWRIVAWIVEGFSN